jgi:two-component system response regulator HydG
VHVDVRMIAATNQDLKQAIAEKRFREDLYYRLNVARFVLPPLRERREDVPQLVDYFLDKYGRKMRRKAKLAEGALEFLQRHDYPGNIRELENLIEQGVALADTGVIGVDDLISPEMRDRSGSSRPGGARQLQDVVDEAEKQWIEKVLVEVDGNKEKAAEALGLSSTTLWRKMKRLNVTGP